MAPDRPGRFPRRALLAGGVLMAALVGAGCSGDDSGPDTTVAVEATVEAVLARTADAMAAVDTAGFEISQTGADVFIDDDGLIRFDGATGRYAAPASADALIQVSAMGLSTEVGAVAIEGETWVTNPLTGRWEDAPSSFSFDPTVLFHPETGWSALLRDGLQEPELVPAGAGDDDRHHIRGTVDADRVSVLTGGLVDEPSRLDIWTDTGTDLVVEAAFDAEGDEGLTSWRLLMDDYGDEVTITEPAAEPGAGPRTGPATTR